MFKRIKKKPQEQTKRKPVRWQELIRIRAEISEIDTKKTTGIVESKSCIFEVINKTDRPFTQLTERKK